MSFTALLPALYLHTTVLLHCTSGAGVQVWNESHAEEEVLGMVIRTGLYTTMGTMLRQVMAPLNAVDHFRDPVIGVSQHVASSIDCHPPAIVVVCLHVSPHPTPTTLSVPHAPIGLRPTQCLICTPNLHPP